MLALFFSATKLGGHCAFSSQSSTLKNSLFPHCSYPGHLQTHRSVLNMLISFCWARATSLFMHSFVLFKGRNEQRDSRLSSCSGQIIHLNALLDHRAQCWTRGCFQARYGLITGVADVEVQQPWHCPSACDERVALLPSLLVAQRKRDRGDRGGGGSMLP